MSRYLRTWAPVVDYLSHCVDCGAAVLDTTAHDLWHTAQADIWAWIDRVAGDSCKTARAVLGDGEPKG